MTTSSAIPTLLLACALLYSPLCASDWPGFLGPSCTNTSPETGLARSWPATGPRVLWSTAVADGFAGPAVRDGLVYLLDRKDDQQDLLRCLDLATGKDLWSVACDAPGTLPYNGSRQVPTVDERLIFALGPFGHLSAIDRQTHQLVWSHHLVNDFKDPAIDTRETPKNRAQSLFRAQVPRWGITQSPLVYKDLLIVAPQTQKVGLAAYDKSTGKLRWTSPYVGRNWFNHVSPALVTLCNADQIIMLAQPSDPEKSPDQAPPALISSINPTTGQILWQTQTPRPYKIPIPQPVQIAPDRLFITGGHGLACLTLTVRNDSNKWTTRITHHKAVASYIHTPILHDGHLYVQSHKDHGGTNVGLVCLDLDLNVKWSTGPSLQFDFGPSLIADNLLFALHGKTGELYLLDPSPAGYKLLAKATVFDPPASPVWSPMALSNGKLLLRDQKTLKCLDVRVPEP